MWRNNKERDGTEMSQAGGERGRGRQQAVSGFIICLDVAGQSRHDRRCRCVGWVHATHIHTWGRRTAEPISRVSHPILPSSDGVPPRLSLRPRTHEQKNR